MPHRFPLTALVCAILLGCGSNTSDGTPSGSDSALDATTAQEGGDDAALSPDAPADSSHEGGARDSGDGAAASHDAGICIPRTCADYPTGTCGAQSDGCGSTTVVCAASDAGLCPPGQFCGGGGPSLCGTGAGASCGPYSGCVPFTCRRGLTECGLAGDGCGGLLDCGPCPPSETCSAGKCIWPTDAGPCVPATCQSLGYDCDSVTDGCGQWLDCGTCPVSQFCGGGGYRRCGGTCYPADGGGGCVLTCSSVDAGSCRGLTCLASTITCGYAPNGCGGLVDCGPCGADGGAD